MTIRLRAAPFNITVIQVYAPTTDYEEEQDEDFYININDHTLDTVSTFKYLGSIISGGLEARDPGQNGTSNSSHDQIKKNMERQQNPTKFQSKTDASPGHLNRPLCMRVLDLDSRAGEKDRSYGDAMLQEAPRHHLPRSGNKRQCFAEW